MQSELDVLVIGAGFGGLACGLELAERGADVMICEALKYPGGCASSFRKEGFQFETGATLFSGLGDDQLFGRWRDRFDLDVQYQLLDPAIEFRSPDTIVSVAARREALLGQFLDMPGAPRESLRAFFATQERVANALWPVLDDPGRLPPFTGAGLAFHAGRLPRYLPVVRWIGRPLGAVLAHHGLEDWAPLRGFLDGLCQITVQASVAEAEAPYALSAMDYCFRGVGHVRGGIGRLAWALLEAARARGAEVRLPARVRGLRRRDGLWEADVRGERVVARQVVANLLPQAVAGLLGHRPDGLVNLEEDVGRGWGAVMLYLVLRDGPELGADPHHLQLVADPSGDFVEGNHLFVSLSGRGEHEGQEEGLRTATVSTHISAAELEALPLELRAARVQAVQERMRRTIGQLAPEVDAAIERVWPGSPRTWARFTRRPAGLVGGVPRRHGLGAYSGLGVSEVEPGLYLVGDSVFPGQSTLSTALGGARTAAAVVRSELRLGR